MNLGRDSGWPIGVELLCTGGLSGELRQAVVRIVSAADHERDACVTDEMDLAASDVVVRNVMDRACNEHVVPAAAAAGDLDQSAAPPHREALGQIYDPDLLVRPTANMRTMPLANGTDLS